MNNAPADDAPKPLIVVHDQFRVRVPHDSLRRAAATAGQAI
ncbi:hypothetical protein ACFL59_07700 [Planctomycetota bacterium]